MFFFVCLDGIQLSLLTRALGFGPSGRGKGGGSDTWSAQEKSLGACAEQPGSNSNITECPFILIGTFG